MHPLSKNGTATLLMRNEIAHVNEEGILEVRSFWKDLCTAVEETERIAHTCPTDQQQGVIPLHPFLTLYGKVWRIGGCGSCQHIFYYPKPLTE